MSSFLSTSLQSQVNFDIMKTSRLNLAALFCFSCTLIANLFGAEPARVSTEMIDVGDHKLQIVRSGSGSPTVVFEAGGGADIKAWSGILPRIGEITSAVSYARAGRGASESGKGPRTPAIVVEELHTLLERAGYKPPYILVGCSMGGAYVRMFAVRYPADVAGLVLVDGVHERLDMELDGLRGFTPAQQAERATASAKEARENKTGQVLDMEKAGWADMFLASSDLGMVGKLPDVPMVVMTSTRSWPNPANRKIWRDLASEVFQATSHGMHIVTDRAGHSIHIEDPDLVVNAIRWVIDSTRPRRNSPVIPLDEIAGPNNSIADRKLGLSATLPAGWTIVSATRLMPDFNNPVWPDGFTGIQLLSPEAQPRIMYQSITDGKAIAATEVDAWLRNRASQIAANKSVGRGVTEYKNRPAGFVSRTVGGRPAMSWAADYKRDGKDWIEDVTLIYGEHIHAMIVVQALATEIEAIRPKFESLVESVRLP